jgi:hypothetical protein
MITREHFESGKPFEFKGRAYKKWEDYIAIEEVTCWEKHCNVKSITTAGILVSTELFGNETVSIIEWKHLTPAE